MLFLSIRTYIHETLGYVPWWHWVIIGMFSLAVFFYILSRKRCSAYGAIVLGMAFFVGAFFLDAAVLNRYFSINPNGVGRELTFRRLFPDDEQGRIELLANISIFVPFGLFLSEYLSELKRLGVWHRMGFVALAGFTLSLCVECLQLVLHVGWFELSDMVLNTIGSFIGAGFSVLGRMAISIERSL